MPNGSSSHVSSEEQKKAGIALFSTSRISGFTGVPDANGRETIGISAFLVILILVVFGRTVRNGFVWDDAPYIYENLIVSKGLSLQGLRWAFVYGEIGHWHPLTWLSHMLDCEVFGMWAGGHHLVNVLLHSTAAILLFLVLFKMTGAIWRSAFVAAAWSIHPLRVESVAWISERKDVLSAVFFMLTFWAYIHYLLRPSKYRYVLLVVLFAFGLMSKNMLVTLPCVLLLLDYWPLNRLKHLSQLPQLLKEKTPLFVLSALSCLITLLVPEHVEAAYYLSPWLRIQNAIVSYCIYLRQTVWPAHLVVLYPNPVHSFAFWQVFSAVGLLCLISVAAFLQRNKFPFLVVGWIWFVGMMAPVIGLVQISNYAHADRYSNLPQIGILIAGTWSVCDLARNNGRRIVLGAIGVTVLSVLMFVANHQVSYWHDNIALWTRALAYTEDNYVAHNDLGVALLKQGKTADAAAQFSEASRIQPGYAGPHFNLGHLLLTQGRTVEAIDEFHEALRMKPDYADAHASLGIALSRQNQPTEAIAEFRKALRINPRYSEAQTNLGEALLQQGWAEEAIAEFRRVLQYDPKYAGAHYNLAIVLLKQGRIEEGITHLQDAFGIDPHFVQARDDLGKVLLQLGRKEEAIARFQESLKINPGDADAHTNLGVIFFGKGMTDEAIAHTQKAFELQPSNLTLEINLAWMLATVPQAYLRNGARAVQLAMQASEASGGNNPMILRTLAAAYAETGDFPQAIQTAQKAIERPEAKDNRELTSGLLREIKLYEAGRTFQQGQ